MGIVVLVAVLVTVWNEYADACRDCSCPQFQYRCQLRWVTMLIVMVQVILGEVHELMVQRVESPTAGKENSIDS
jgi:hypothetical protein